MRSRAFDRIIGSQPHRTMTHALAKGNPGGGLGRARRQFLPLSRPVVSTKSPSKIAPLQAEGNFTGTARGKDAPAARESRVSSCTRSASVPGLARGARRPIGLSRKAEKPKEFREEVAAHRPRTAFKKLQLPKLSKFGLPHSRAPGRRGPANGRRETPGPEAPEHVDALRRDGRAAVFPEARSPT